MLDDGNFRILMTLNNSDELVNAKEFERLKFHWKKFWKRNILTETIICLPRQDAPDSVDLTEGEAI